MVNISARLLTAMKFFQRLPLELVQSLLNAGTIQSIPQKTLLFSSGEHLQNVLILLSGEVSIYNITKHGQRKILFFLGKGHLLNHDINSSRPLSLSCESVTQVLVMKIPKQVFLKFMEENFPLTQAVLDEYQRYLWRLAHQLKNTSGSMITERKIAAKLWKLGRDFGERRPEGIYITLPFTMTLMADFVGVPRENVSRACKSLAGRGLLIYRDRHFILPNPDGLAEFYKM